jgi:hypothetical protein
MLFLPLTLGSIPAVLLLPESHPMIWRRTSMPGTRPGTTAYTNLIAGLDPAIHGIERSEIYH